MGTKLSDVMIGGPTPGGMTPGIGRPDPNKLAQLMEQWKKNVALIPPDMRYQYALNQNEMGADARTGLQGTLNSYIPPANGLNHFNEQNDAPIDNPKYEELINKGLWRILLKDKKDIDENDVNFINEINKFVARPTIPETDTGKGQYRYYFDPVTYLAKQGVIGNQPGTTGFIKK